MPRFILPMISTLLFGAIFGFFYAWVCSTMWGLDALPPDVAITAMQGMNASVRNVIFAPAFFGTSLVGALTALSLWRYARGAALCFAAASVVYLVGGQALTAAINVPMNQALAAVDLGTPGTDPAQIWADYSARWQIWNSIRTLASGVALMLAAAGLIMVGRASVRAAEPRG